MMEQILATDVRFAAADSDTQKSGLLGWVSFTINGSLRVDGIALRRTARGQLALSFPSRRDRAGRLHAVIRPLDDLTRLAIETQVFDQLGLKERTS